MKAPTFAPAYCALYPKLAELARQHGYALAIHGSGARDFDLVAIPWRDAVSDPGFLIAAIVERFDVRQIGPPTIHHHGRIAVTLSVAFGECAIDLSFVNAMQVNP